jgi:ketosteroid isomerase-like protein
VEDAELQARLAALEEQVRRLEDQVAVHRLINTWGPAVDTGQAEAAAALFSEDAVLQSDMSHLTGPAAIADMVRSDGQQALIDQGSAHIPAFPVVDIDGDTARAIGYSRVYLHTDEGYEVWRVSANYWEFTRTLDGWRVSRRTNHVIDGGPQAQQLLGRWFAQQG